MATLYISEFKDAVSTIGTTKPQVMPQPSLLDQTVAISGASAQSAPFNALTRAVLISSDVVCSILFGANPTAADTNFRLPANTPIIFGVIPGQMIGVIANT